jgi:hypothetical protein
VAEDITTADVLTGGCLDVGLGREYQPYELTTDTSHKDHPTFVTPFFLAVYMLYLRPGTSEVRERPPQ